MGKIEDDYLKLRSLVKEKDYLAASDLAQIIYNEKPTYKSIAYFYGKIEYELKKYKHSEKLLANFVRQKPRPKANMANAYSFMANLAIVDEDADTAMKLLKKAARFGLSNKKLDQINKKIERLKLADEPIEKRTNNSKFRVRMDRLASNGTPIVTTTEKGYQSAYIFVDKLDFDQIRMLSDREWYELRMTTPRYTNIPGYMSASALESRTLYEKYLPKMTDIRYMSAFNDYLEENLYFQQKWELSKVFALLQVSEFNKGIVEQLLTESHLIDGVVLKHLVAIDDLTILKESGEVMSVNQKKHFKALELMQSDEFGFLNSDESQGVLYLNDKLRYEKEIKSGLVALSSQDLPFSDNTEDFEPLDEQVDFLQWLKGQNRRIVSLLGVGGSGKTFVLGHVLDTSKVVGLAPTHKAKLNLVDNGFYVIGTVQSVVANTPSAQEFKQYDTVVIDEVSMLTVEMMAKVLSFFPSTTRFILVGDEAQLPPVSLDEDALSVTGDLMGLIKKFGTGFFFTENRRAKNDKLRDFIANVRSAEDNYIRQTNSYRSVSYMSMLQDKKQHLDLEDVMILAYSNNHVAQVNEYFYKNLGANSDVVVPFFKRGKYGRGGFFVGAKVMFYNNDDSFIHGYTTSEYGEITDLRVSNVESGDYGEVEITISGTGKVYKLPVWQAKRDLLLAYAITIHKSQGSGARKVYVMEAADYGLAYTAVSRAKEELVFVDYSREQLIQALHTPSPEKLNLYN
ncbi:ATP-dependent DNA helicase [Weissella confusa]|uniref:ATP-dependent DNA helicase n=1 Tax=Weissella confusa TaxID=1583 RepID=UPI0010806683|nr:AAA family ATPase [Weissella confusa]MBJ7629063.1 AAA family ATPase [Weissella confusa]TGE48819.1 exonuclease V subunit alpha [Weissella confusa]